MKKNIFGGKAEVKQISNKEKFKMKKQTEF